MCSFLPSELQVSNNITVMSSYVTDMCSFLLSELQVGNNITVMSSYVTDMCSFLLSELQVGNNITVMSSYVTVPSYRMNTSGRNVDFWYATNHVTVPTTSWAVRIQ